MAFIVRIALEAFKDIDAIVAYIHERSPHAATQSRESLFRRLVQLETFPHSGGLAPENRVRAPEIRQLLFGRYRILYTIPSDREVLVLTVRHGARRKMPAKELRERFDQP